MTIHFNGQTKFKDKETFVRRLHVLVTKSGASPSVNCQCSVSLVKYLWQANNVYSY